MNIQKKKKCLRWRSVDTLLLSHSTISHFTGKIKVVCELNNDVSLALSASFYTGETDDVQSSRKITKVLAFPVRKS